MKRRRSWTIRPSGGAFIVSAAALALALAAPAAAVGSRGPERSARASAPAVTELTLERKAEKLRYGEKLVLSARLTSAGQPLNGRTIGLRSAGAAVSSAPADARGVATFELKATRSGDYEARFDPVSPQDAAAYQPAASKPLSVVVRPIVSVRLSSPLRAGRKIVGVPGVRLRVSGSVRPYVPGAPVVVRVERRGRRVGGGSRTVLARAGNGRFSLSFKLRRRGTYVVGAEQIETPELGSGKARSKRLLVVRPRAHSGSRGPAARALQRRLRELGYVTRVNGHFGADTARAVLAFRKVFGMRRTTFAGRAIFRRLAKGGGSFRLRHPKAGKHVEFDWSRQVLVLARGAKPVKVLHASSGTPSTPTVFGHYRFYSKTPGFNAKGMYYSNYFIGGYAIHGYASVPTYAASHGCIRIPIPSAIGVFRWIRHGDPIYVYR